MTSHRLPHKTFPVFAMFVLALALGASLLLAGCPHNAAARLPANAVGPVDAGIYESLAAAHAYAAKWLTDVRSGAYKPGAAEDEAMRQLVLSLNTADPLYISYHNALVANPSAGEPAELAAAITAVTENLSGLIALAKAR